MAAAVLARGGAGVTEADAVGEEEVTAWNRLPGAASAAEPEWRHQGIGVAVNLTR